MASFVPAHSGVAVLDFHEVPLRAFDHLSTFYDFFSTKAKDLSNPFRKGFFYLFKRSQYGPLTAT
jgi:hypothetical protein